MVGKKQQLKLIKNVSHFEFKAPYIFTWLFSIFICCFITVASASAIASISQSYKSEERLPIGSIVSLKPGTSNEIIAATSNTSDAIFGVVINNDNSILSLENQGTNSIYVTTSELVPVLISDINGEIHQGDPITASPIKGVGMKATSNAKIVGVAHEEPINSQAIQSYVDNEGTEKTVKLGQVSVLISVAYYYKEPEKTIIPAALQNIANAMAGKTVETLPIIISLIVFIVTIIVVVSIIYAMIRSSIISVGRNPMSQSAIYRDLVQLSALVLIILAAGMIAIYLILTRM